MSDTKEDRTWYAEKTMRAAHALFVERFAYHPEIQKVLLNGYLLSYWCLKHKVLDVSKINSPTIDHYVIASTKKTAIVLVCSNECPSEPDVSNLTESLDKLTKVMDYLDQQGLQVVSDKNVCW